ncbi:MAG: endonuclease/exonuclease/phosphatase family protein [Chloroflexi bacterium]|nr:endonuclease/exonuclease/phosphatase family protein [Chloroflexota bacterium]
MGRLHVATFNVRYTADRWAARLPLIRAAMASLQPDVIGLQEVIYPLQQDRALATAGPARYRMIRGWAYEVEMGNSLLVAERLGAVPLERLDLGRARSATGAVVTSMDGTPVVVAVTEFHHRPEDGPTRAAQAAQLVDWLDAAPTNGAAIVLADCNETPGRAAGRVMTAAGFRSAHAEANGHEPKATWPSGSSAERSGGRARRQGGWLWEAEAGVEPAGCYDYIWVRGGVTVESCGLAFERPAAHDPTLYPSDHFGLAAVVAVGRGGDRT